MTLKPQKLQFLRIILASLIWCSFATVTFSQTEVPINSEEDAKKFLADTRKNALDSRVGSIEEMSRQKSERQLKFAAESELRHASHLENLTRWESSVMKGIAPDGSEIEEIMVRTRDGQIDLALRGDLGQEQRAALLDSLVDASMQGPPTFSSPEHEDIIEGPRTPETQTVGNDVIFRTTIRNGDVVQEYKKVMTLTGTYYFCGSRSISKSAYDLGTYQSSN